MVLDNDGRVSVGQAAAGHDWTEVLVNELLRLGVSIESW